MIKKYKEIWIPFTCFLLIAILLLCNQVLPIDLWVYRKMEGLIHEPITTIMKIFTFLGEPKTIVIFSFLWAIYLFKKEKEELKPFCSILLISVCFIVCLKLLFMRERPDILRLIPIDGYSFPSGHSIISVSFYGYLMTYFIEHSKKTILFIPGIFFILGIGLSRIYLGVHYFSDVLAGYSLGALTLGIGSILRRKWGNT